MKPIKLLLTGFGAFADVVDNPTARIVEHFAQTGIERCELTTRVFDVSFKRAEKEVQTLLNENRFDAAMLLGVAGRSEAIRLEQFGRNWDDARLPDIDGDQPLKTVIASEASDVYPTPFDLKPILKALTDAGFKARISESAGEYVCNHTYFAALHAIVENQLSTQCLFVHLPPDERTFAIPADSAPMLPFERQVKAVKIVIAQVTPATER